MDMKKYRGIMDGLKKDLSDACGNEFKDKIRTIRHRKLRNGNVSVKITFNTCIGDNIGDVSWLASDIIRRCPNYVRWALSDLYVSNWIMDFGFSLDALLNDGEED